MLDECLFFDSVTTFSKTLEGRRFHLSTFAIGPDMNLIICDNCGLVIVFLLSSSLLSVSKLALQEEVSCPFVAPSIAASGSGFRGHGHAQPPEKIKALSGLYRYRCQYESDASNRIGSYLQMMRQTSRFTPSLQQAGYHPRSRINQSED